MERHSAIKDLVADAIAAESAIANQDELRKKLARRGFAVTQATLSRDIHALQLVKSRDGYLLPDGGSGRDESDAEEDDLPALAGILQTFGLRVRQAQNLLVVQTMMGGAQPVAAALDREAMAEVVGTVAGDDTVLVVCPDNRVAAATAKLLTRLIG